MGGLPGLFGQGVSAELQAGGFQGCAESILSYEKGFEGLLVEHAKALKTWGAPSYGPYRIESLRARAGRIAAFRDQKVNVDKNQAVAPIELKA